MTIQIELNPEVEARLAAEARACGIALEEHARRLLQEAIGSMPRRRSRPSQVEFLDALASKAPNVPHLRTETFSRGMIYGEHD